MLHPWPTGNIWLVFIWDEDIRRVEHTHTYRALWLKPSSYRLVLLHSALFYIVSWLRRQRSEVRGDGDDTHFGKVPTRGTKKDNRTFFLASATRDISYRGTTASQCLPCRWDTSYWLSATGQHKPDGRGACRVISWGKNNKGCVEKITPPVYIIIWVMSIARSNYRTSSPSSSIERHIVHFSSVSSSSSSMQIFSSRGLLYKSHGRLLVF